MYFTLPFSRWLLSQKINLYDCLSLLPNPSSRRADTVPDRDHSIQIPTTVPGMYQVLTTRHLSKCLSHQFVSVKAKGGKMREQRWVGDGNIAHLDLYIYICNSSSSSRLQNELKGQQSKWFPFFLYPMCTPHLPNWLPKEKVKSGWGWRLFFFICQKEKKASSSWFQMKLF